MTRGFTRGCKRGLAAAVTATLMVSGMVAASITSAPAAQAATEYGTGTVDNADPTPVMGWSTWSFTRFKVNEAEVEEEANAFESTGLASVGYDYVNIDDGWYECPTTSGPSVDAYGRWIPDSTPYPGSGSLNGIQVLANYVHSLGLKFGIYETAGISKNAVSAATPILEPGQTGLPGSQATVPGQSAATIITSPAKRQANYNCGDQDAINYGSLSTAEGQAAQDYTDSVVDELASWGVDYIKLDGISNSNGPDVEAWQAAIAQSGRPIVLNITQGSFTGKLAPTLSEYANQWEEPPDIEVNGPSEGSADACNVGSTFPLSSQPFTGCTDVFPLTSYSHWDDRFAFFGGSGSNSFEWYGGPGNFNDGDSIEVGDGSTDSGMSEAASETQLGLWSMGSAPLILGGDLSASISNGYGTIAAQNSAGLVQPDQSLLMDKQVIAVDQDAEDAVQVSKSGVLASTSAAGSQVFAKVEPNGDAIVALFNTSAETSPATASISTTVAAVNSAVGTFNSNVASKTAGTAYPPPAMNTLAVDPNGYEVQDLWGTDSLDTGGSLATGVYGGTISSAGSMSATVPSEGVALFRVTPLSEPCITAAYSGGLTVSAGESVCVSAGGSVDGPVNVDPGGALWVNAGGSVGGPVNVDPGGALWASGGSLTGPLNSSGALALTLCGTAVTGPLSVSGSTGYVLVGGATCPGNELSGPARLTSNSGGLSFEDNTVTGPAALTGNSGGFLFEGDTITGPVTNNDNT